MTRERVDEMMKNYRTVEARCEYLRAQVSILEASLEENRKQMINDKVSMSQAITGMPHGTTVGDPVGNLALDIAMGNVTVFMQQIEDELAAVKKELNSKQYVLVYVNSWLKGLNDREKMVVVLKNMDGQPWGQIVDAMKKQYGEDACSKHSAQRLYDRAMEKIYEVAA